VIHTGKKYFAGSTSLALFRPGEEFLVRWIFSAMGVDNPVVVDSACINGKNDAL
jgi:hypothetical protein